MKKYLIKILSFLNVRSKKYVFDFTNNKTIKDDLKLHAKLIKAKEKGYRIKIIA